MIKTGIYCSSYLGLISGFLDICYLLCNEGILSFLKAKILKSFKETEIISTEHQLIQTREKLET